MALNLDVTKLTDKQLRESCRCADSGGDCEFCIEQFHRDEDREHANLETPRRTFAKPAQTVAEFKRGEPRTQIDQLNNQYSLYRDGRLISVQHFDTLAAAPELLEALEYATLEHSGHCDGQSPDYDSTGHIIDRHECPACKAKAAIAKAKGEGRG